MKITCKNCGHSEETSKDLWVKIIGGALPIGGYYAWVTYLLAGTGMAMPIVVAMILGGTGLLIFRDTVVEWLTNRGYKCEGCGHTDWKA